MMSVWILNSFFFSKVKGIHGELVEDVTVLLTRLAGIVTHTAAFY
jgi:hypothetical protein